MAGVKCSMEGDELIIALDGRVDSTNSRHIEQRITTASDTHHPTTAILDCEDLEYISSAGLRILLRLAKTVRTLRIANVSSAVYEVLEMTGFTEMFDVTKAYRRISVEGCEVIGEGANGKVYRIDPDTIVKVYLNPDSLPEIQRERELARTAFVLGVPTAIPYDVVRVGDGYGSVFELLNAQSLAQLLSTGAMTVDEAAEMSVELLKTMHDTVVRSGIMPSMRDVALEWMTFLRDYLPVEQADRLYELVEAVPEDMHMLHGDFHVKNVMVQNGEALLIDMDTLCHGHPIFELASAYNAYVGFAETDHDIVASFLGLSYETCGELWSQILHGYLGNSDEAYVRSIEEKACLLGSARIMRRTIRRGEDKTVQGARVVEACRRHFDELLPRIDTLLF